MLPPLRSSHPWRYIFAVVLRISVTKGAEKMSFICLVPSFFLIF